MKKFIVIDKQEGFSWINDTIEEVIESVGYDSEEDKWEKVKKEIKGIYEVIEVSGEVNYIVE